MRRAAAENDGRVSLGTVRGRVEMRSGRGGSQYALCELVDGRAVMCYPTTDTETALRDARGRVADVTGTVQRDPATDQPRSIHGITSVDLVEQGTSTAYRSARGVLKTREPAEVLIRRMRDAQ